MLEYIALFFGCTLLYAAILLHEVEEESFQEALERWWVGLDDAGTKWFARHVLFGTTFCRGVLATMSRLFGPDIASRRAATAYMCWATATWAFVSGVLILAYPDLPSMTAFLLSAGLAIVAGTFGICAVYCTSTRFGRVVVVIGAFLTPLFVLLLWLATKLIVDGAFLIDGAFIIDLFSSLWTGLALATGSLAIYLAIVRKTLAHIAEAKRALIAARGFFGMGAASAVIMGTPIALAITLGDTWLGGVGVFWFCGAAIGVGAVGLLMLVWAIGLAVHRLLWPLIKRPVYAFQRLGVKPRKTAIMAAALTLLAFGGVPVAKDALKALIP